MSLVEGERPAQTGWPAARAAHLQLSGVCLLSGEFPPESGGVGDYTARLAEALASLGVPVGVLTSRRIGRPTRWVHRRHDQAGQAGVPVHGWVPVWDARAWPLVMRALNRLGPRPVLHIQYQTAAFGLQGAVNLLPAWVRLASPRSRIVTTFHDFRAPYLFPKAGPLRAGANQLLARLSHAAIFSDPADLADAQLGLTEGAIRGHVIPIGSNLDCAPPPDLERADLRRLLGADEDTLLVGYFGFFNASKGLPTLLEAIGSLAASNRRVRLALVGAQAGVSDPSDLAAARQVHDTIGRLGLEDLVTATGHLPAEDVSAALLACDLIALPYRDGASPRRGTLMAALVHGLPIVSTRRVGSEQWEVGSGAPAPVELRDGEQLLLVPPDDGAALAGAIARLADDPDLRARLAANARAAAARVTWPEIARQTIAVYENEE